jgi:hypothetical protein
MTTTWRPRRERPWIADGGAIDRQSRSWAAAEAVHMNVPRTRRSSRETCQVRNACEPRRMCGKAAAPTSREPSRVLGVDLVAVLRPTGLSLAGPTRSGPSVTCSRELSVELMMPGHASARPAAAEPLTVVCRSTRCRRTSRRLLTSLLPSLRRLSRTNGLLSAAGVHQRR